MLRGDPGVKWVVEEIGDGHRGKLYPRLLPFFRRIHSHQPPPPLEMRLGQSILLRTCIEAPCWSPQREFRTLGALPTARVDLKAACLRLRPRACRKKHPSQLQQRKPQRNPQRRQNSVIPFAKTRPRHASHVEKES